MQSKDVILDLRPRYLEADAHVKHGQTLHTPNLAQGAADLAGRSGADAVIVSGTATGAKTALEDLQAARRAIGRTTLLAGSGVTLDTVQETLAIADGVIVGTALKKSGRTRYPVDPARVRSFVRKARQ